MTTPSQASMLKDANGNFIPQYWDSDLGAYVAYGPNQDIVHISVPYTQLNVATATIKLDYKQLNPKAKKRSMAIINNTDQNSGNINYIVLDSMGGAITWVESGQSSGGSTEFNNANYNNQVIIDQQLFPAAGIVVVPPGGGSTSWLDYPGDTLHVEIQVGSTAPTTGQYDIFIREVGTID